MDTLLLDLATHDLLLDASGNIAVASDPYALAQDAGTACATWLGEAYFDTTLGVPWRQQVFGKSPALSLLKEQLREVALREVGARAQSVTVFVATLTARRVVAQVQVVPAGSGDPQSFTFNVVKPV